MDPTSEKRPESPLDLPQAAAAGGAVESVPAPVPEVNQQTEAHNMELPAAPAAAPVAPADGQGMVSTAAQPPLSNTPTEPMATATQTSPITDDSALSAEDSDLIEKAWVEKAKAIVAQTKDDPHKQNAEINKVKASYIKKRYNKDIKLSEDATQ